MRSLVVRLGLCFVVALSAVACSDGERELQVQLVTGLVAGPEFTQVETTLFVMNAGTTSPIGNTIETETGIADNFERGQSVASFATLPGSYRVRVRLRRADGSLLAQQTAAVTVNDHYVLPVHITRDCAGVVCEGGGELELSACLAGRCVDPQCDAQHPELCPDIDFCASAAACPAVASCARQECIDGLCVEQMIPNACAEGEWCNPDSGCKSLGGGAPGVLVTPTAGLMTRESGGTAATFTIVLLSRPNAEVSIGVAVGDASEGTVSPASLTFTQNTWDVPQSVTVNGVDDGIRDGDVAYAIETSGASSSDPAYEGMVVDDVLITNSDDELGPFAPSIYVKSSNLDAQDHFANSVALSADGNTMAIGAPGEDSSTAGVGVGGEDDNSASRSGAVYLYTRVGGVWTQDLYIKSSNAGADDSFGTAVALSADGSTLAIGAPGEASNARGINGEQADDSQAGAGAVYVFTRTDSLWTEVAYVKASNTRGLAYFGQSIALSSDGTTMVVGAPGEGSEATGINGDQTDAAVAIGSGAAYVFHYASEAWTQQAYIKASNTALGQRFANHLALSANGDLLAVGSRGDSSNATGVNGDHLDESAPGAGALYVFARVGTSWMQEAYIKASNTQEADDFGGSVALSADGSTLAAGAIYEASSAIGIDGNQLDDSGISSGAVYVFARGSEGWVQEAYVKATNTGNFDLFGISVALTANGNLLAVGAYGESSGATGVNGNQLDDSVLYSGAVYTYSRYGGTWMAEDYLKASNPDSMDHFGESLALSRDGSTLVAGTQFEASAARGIGGDQNDDSAMNAGAAYVFAR